MARHTTRGASTLERIRERYESTEKKCSDCGHVDEEANWTAETDGRRIVYRHVCPRCGADREHVFEFG